MSPAWSQPGQPQGPDIPHPCAPAAFPGNARAARVDSAPCAPAASPEVLGLPAVPCPGQLWLLGTQTISHSTPACSCSSRGVSETSSVLCHPQFRVPALGEHEQLHPHCPVPPRSCCCSSVLCNCFRGAGEFTGSVEEKQIEPRWLNWVPAWLFTSHRFVLEAVLGVTRALAWVNVLSHLLNVINVLWPKLTVSPPGEESGRKASAVPALLTCWEWPRGCSLVPAGNVHSAGEAWRITGSVDVALSERLFSFPLVWLGRKGKKKIQVIHRM